MKPLLCFNKIAFTAANRRDLNNSWASTGLITTTGT